MVAVYSNTPADTSNTYFNHNTSNNYNTSHNYNTSNTVYNYNTSNASSNYNISNNADKKLDLVFLLDTTGSMGPYIRSATDNIKDIVAKIVQSEKINPYNLRFALVAYRDHPPQERSFVVNVYPFTSDTQLMQSQLSVQNAHGGGDGPEAVTAAMYTALNLQWRSDATRIVILIADAPPHGLGESGDGFPNGDPDGHDPLRIARDMSRRGIVIYPVACEPALSAYNFATDFFRALARITGGQMVPLTRAQLLVEAIVGGAQEQIELERLIKEYTADIERKVRAGMSETAIAKDLHEKLVFRGTKTQQLKGDVDIYNYSPEAESNVAAYETSENLREARQRTTIVRNRLSAKFSPSDSGMSFERGVAPLMEMSGFFAKSVPMSPSFGCSAVSPMQTLRVAEDTINFAQVQRLVKQTKSRLSGW